jgi:hypothetical protein
VDETRLICFERRAAPTCPLFGVWDDRVLDSFRILFGIVAYYLCVKVVDEAKGPAVTIDLLFDEVGVIVNIEER